MIKIFTTLLATIPFASASVIGTSGFNYDHNKIVKSKSLFQDPEPLVADNIYQTENDNIYAFSVSTGLNISSNGTTFSHLSSVPTDTGSFFQSSNGIYYAGTSLEGLYQSTDGKTFHANSTLTDQYISSFYENKATHSLYVTTENNLFVSKDGQKFTIVNEVPSDIFYDTIWGANDGTIYISSENGLYRTTDGINFKLVFTATTMIPYLRDFHETSNGNIYALGGDAIVETLCESTDNGQTFAANKTLPSNVEQLIYEHWGITTTGNNVQVALQAKGLYQSTDGTNFKQNQSVSQHKVTYVMQIGTDTYVSGINWLYKSTDGINFTKNPLAMRFIKKIYQAHNKFIYTLSRKGMYLSIDNGNKFNPIFEQ